VGRTLVTGATGFIGSHLVRALAARGDELRLLVRAASRLEHLQGVEFEVVTGDVLDRDSVRRALNGADRVFHVAGSTSMRSKDREWVRRLNVEGTRNVLEEALAAGVERAVHTSSIAAVGAAPPGGAIDESASFNVGHLGIAYVNSKHEAELEAMRLYSAGLPVVVVNPSFVFGPDDPTGTSMGLIRRFLLRRIPVYVDGAINVVDVRDVAQGMLLADERGRPGERYILAARNFTLDRLFADLARISGVDPPALKLPGPVVLAALEAGSRLGLRLPSSPDEVRSAMQWWTCRNDKARRELGFQPRPHEETLADAVRWQREQLGGRVGGRASRAERLAGGVVGAVAGVGGRLLGR
jgi:dihydroflavonol-4-reductase